MPVQKAGTRVSVIVRDSGGNNGTYTVIMVKIEWCKDSNSCDFDEFME